MLEKGVKWHLPSWQRKQYRQPSYPRDPPGIVNQHEASGQKSQMEIYSPNVHLDQL